MAGRLDRHRQRTNKERKEKVLKVDRPDDDCVNEMLHFHLFFFLF